MSVAVDQKFTVQSVAPIDPEKALNEITSDGEQYVLLKSGGSAPAPTTLILQFAPGRVPPEFSAGKQVRVRLEID